ncbi:hypothetical protein niasHT_030683 [Heterodera trifolii]|uniref:Uncharacterized protein n=1 Tax=Heterodera trifolii TaxID=157864 RepID=A0ABD2HNT6_9BILA
MDKLNKLGRVGEGVWQMMSRGQRGEGWRGMLRPPLPPPSTVCHRRPSIRLTHPPVFFCGGQNRLVENIEGGGDGELQRLIQTKATTWEGEEWEGREEKVKKSNGRKETRKGGGREGGIGRRRGGEKEEERERGRPWHRSNGSRGEVPRDGMENQ